MNNIENSYHLTLVTLTEAFFLIAESQDAFLPTTDHPKSDPQGFLEYAAKEPNFKLFALTNSQKEMVGYITNIKDKDQEDIAAIGPMYISESFRGKGLGELQVELFIDWARESGYKSIKTKTWGNNKASRKIFGNLGFEVYEIKENDRVDGDSTVKYIKTL